jgi:ribosome-binding factor A
MKHRLERVKEVIKRELSEIVAREITFHATLVTIQDVDLTPDLKHAHIFVGALGNEPDRVASIKLLQRHRVALQHALSKRVILKYTPQLHFKLDESIERGNRIISILDAVVPPEVEVEDEQESGEE